MASAALGTPHAVRPPIPPRGWSTERPSWQRGGGPGLPPGLPLAPRGGKKGSFQGGSQGWGLNGACEPSLGGRPALISPALLRRAPQPSGGWRPPSSSPGLPAPTLVMPGGPQPRCCPLCAWRGGGTWPRAAWHPVGTQFVQAESPGWVGVGSGRCGVIWGALSQCCLCPARRVFGDPSQVSALQLWDRAMLPLAPKPQPLRKQAPGR